MADETPVDRLSELPESLITEILSSLPTKEAVATSILSQSWRFRWTNITSFHFDNAGEDSKNPKEDSVEFIDTVLHKHSGKTINGFFLVWASANFRPEHLNKWIGIAISQNLRHLGLQTVSKKSCEFPLPCSLYACGTLEVLQLEGPFLIEPPNVISLPKLTHLTLKAVMYESDESAPILISACPVLHSLVMIRKHKGDNLVACIISSPVLKQLHIDFIAGLGDLELEINAPALESLRLHDNMCGKISIEPSSVEKVVFDPPSTFNKVVALMARAFRSVKILSLYPDALDAILFDNLAPVLVALKEGPAELPRFEGSLMHLIDVCTKLEELSIWWIKPATTLWENPACVPKCLSSCLRCVTMVDFEDSEDKMSMLEYFVEHGAVMERVNICFEREIRMDEEKRLEITNKVSQFAMASPACKFFYLDLSEAELSKYFED